MTPEIEKNAAALRILAAVDRELVRAEEMFPAFRSDHEALGVLREEYLEFERAVFHGSPRDRCEEALQVAAMAVRFLLHCADPIDLTVAENRLAEKAEYKKARRRARAEEARK